MLFGFLIFFNPVIKLFIFFVPFYSLLRLFVVIGLFYPRNEYTMKLHRILMMARSKCKTLVEEKMKSLMWLTFIIVECRVCSTLSGRASAVCWPWSSHSSTTSSSANSLASGPTKQWFRLWRADSRPLRMCWMWELALVCPSTKCYRRSARTPRSSASILTNFMCRKPKNCSKITKMSR